MRSLKSEFITALGQIPVGRELLLGIHKPAVDVKALSQNWRYKNVDIEKDQHTKNGLAVVWGQRLGYACDIAGIAYVEATAGWTGHRKWRRPQLIGVAVSPEHVPILERFKEIRDGR